jgi:hypothetical protein
MSRLFYRTSLFGQFLEIFNKNGQQFLLFRLEEVGMIFAAVLVL